MECLFDSKKFKNVEKKDFNLEDLSGRVFVLVYDERHKEILLELFKTVSKNTCGARFISYQDDSVSPSISYYKNSELEDRESYNLSYLSIFNFVNKR